MLLSLARRIILFLSSIFLVGFALIYVHSLHEGSAFPWYTAGIGAAAALLALAWNWIGIIKSDDYLIPTHARVFLLVTGLVSALITLPLFAYFLFSDQYPGSYLLYFGVIPSALAVGYILIAGIRMKEVYLLPPEYRPDVEGKFSSRFPVGVGLLAMTFAAGTLALTTSHLAFESRFDASTPERKDPAADLDASERARQAEEFFQLAKTQQQDNRYRHAHELLQRAATLDHPEADYELGLIYSGDGYLRNLPLAYRHFQQAHSKGHVESSFILGRAYRHGELSLAPNYERARQFLETAATLGHSDAQVQLGHLYNRGQGLEADVERAFYWFKKAAEQGDAIAQNDVGIFYVNGTGVERNPDEGLRWLTIAAEQGATVAEYNLGRVLYEGTMVPQDYEKAFEYFGRLAEKRIPYGFQMQGLQHFYGQGIPQDYAAAAASFARGAARGNTVSQYYLAYCYLHGLGIDRNTPAALNYLEASATNGHQEGQLLLARLHLEGAVLLQDRAGAATWFRVAAENGSEEAATELTTLKASLTTEEAADFEARYTLLQQKRRG